MPEKPTGHVHYKNQEYAYYITPVSDIPELVEISVPDLNFTTGYGKEYIQDFLDDFANILEAFESAREESQQR